MTRWRDTRCGGLADRVGSRAALAGWVAAIGRGDDGVVLDVRDETGVARVALADEAADVTEESVVRVEGTVEEGPLLRAGSLEVLSRAEALPFRPDEDGVDEATRLRHRWIDLRSPRLHRNLRLRARMVEAIRAVMAERGYLQAETPLLGKPMPEGGREFVVATRSHPDRFFALPQSPQLHQLLLLAGGVDRTYEIARCFRDEPAGDLSLHEFSQLSVTLAFPEPQEILAVFEELVARIWRHCLGVELETPFPRLPWSEARRRYGTDKPDLRIGCEIEDVDGARRLVASRRLDEREAALVEDGLEAREGVARFRRDEAGGSTAYVCSGEEEAVTEALGEARRRLVPLLAPEAPEACAFVWVTDFPLFVWDEEWQVLVTEHNPMTPPVPESLPLLQTDPGSAVGASFDLVCNGIEIGSGSSGIDRHDVQVRMLEIMALEPELQHYWIGPLLDCLRTGMPPHEGAGLGLDRVAMLLAGERTVREVVAFPQDGAGRDLMRDSPSAVGEGKLAEFGLVRSPAQEPAAGAAP